MKAPDKGAAFRRALTATTTARLLECDGLTDFGGVRRCRPRAVVLGTTEAEARAVLQLAKERGLGVRIRGAGHSVAGQTLGADVVLLNRAAEAQVRILDEERVAVSGRTSWTDLEAALNRAGRTAPVLTDYLDLTVGGTLSVGGYGVRSVLAGAQVRHIEQIRLIDYGGEAHWIGPRDWRFAQALGGLGQAGLIEEVVMRTMPLPALTEVHTYRHRDLDDLLEAITTLETAAPDQFSAWLTHEEIVSEYGHFGTAHLRPCPTRAQPIGSYTTSRYPQLLHTQRAVWLAPFRSDRKVWADFQLPMAQFGAFARRVERQIRGDEFRYLAIRYLLVCRASPPLGTLAPTDGSSAMHVGMGFYFMVPARSGSGLDDSRRGIRRCLEMCLELGGRPYLYGLCPLREDEARALYGRHSSVIASYG